MILNREDQARKGVTVSLGKLSQLIKALENVNAVNQKDRGSGETGSI